MSGKSWWVIPFQIWAFLKIVFENILKKIKIFNNLTVSLIDPKNIRVATEEVAPKLPSKQQMVSDNLFEELKKLRKSIAEKEKIPPYMVFNDATLTEIAKEKPISAHHLKKISGIGEKKLELYGEQLISTVFEFLKLNTEENVKNTTYIQTFELYKQGLAMEEIAQKRELSTATIFSHLINLYENNYDIDVYKFVTHKEMNKVFNAVKALKYEYKLKELYTHLNEEIDYSKIKFALANFTRNGKI